jgi:energy-coupling factor transporter transmembrane protein EcfT
MNSLSIYVARESGLHHLNPITKFVITLCILICGFALPGILTGYLIVCLVIIPLAAWGQVTKRMVGLVFNISWPLILSVFIIQTFFWGKGTSLFEIGFIAPKFEGLLFAVNSSGRIIFIMADFILFSLTTRPDTLMISLKQSGLPSGLAYIIVTTLQLVPQFVSKANTILDAQRSRGLETQGNLATRARALLPLVLPLVVGSLLEVEERAIAIEARAFNSNKVETSIIEIPDSQNQKVLRYTLVVITILIIAGRYTWLS